MNYDEFRKNLLQQIALLNKSGKNISYTIMPKTITLNDNMILTKDCIQYIKKDSLVDITFSYTINNNGTLEFKKLKSNLSSPIIEVVDKQILEKIIYTKEFGKFLNKLL